MSVSDTPNIRSALAALVDAMRTGYDGGSVHPEQQLDMGHDPEFLSRAAPLLEFLYAKYFRVRMLGLEHVPDTGPALVVANHSGGIPYDGTMLLYGLYRDHPAHRRLRPLVANFAFHARWMRHVVAKVGGVRAARENALPMLARGELLGVFPEGLKGVGKLYRERYRLVRFGRGGFVRLAREARVPIVPTAIIGAEEIHPVLAKVTTLAEPLGLPYIPITPTFPLLGPLGLLPVPTKWTIRFGPPIEVPPGVDEETTTRSAEEVRSRIDAMIAELLAQRRSILFG